MIMKKKGLTLTVSIVCIGCLFGVYALLKAHNVKTEAEEEAAASKPILELDTENPAAFSFGIGEENIEFEYKDGTWIRTDDDTFPVDGEAIKDVLADLAAVSAVRTLEDVEDISEYGFDNPRNTFIYTDMQGNTTTITIGANNESTGDDYLLVDDGEESVYTISTTLRSSISADVYDYAVSEELPDIREEDIEAVAVNKSEGSYRIYKEGTTWYVEADDGTVLSADKDTVESGLSTLCYSLSYSDFLEHNCTDASAYGIDENAAVFTILYSAQEAETVSETEAPEDSEDICELTFHIGTVDAFENYYVQKEGSAEVHTISGSVLEDFLKGSAEDWKEEETETETERSTETEHSTETENSTEDAL